MSKQKVKHPSEIAEYQRERFSDAIVELFNLSSGTMLRFHYLLARLACRWILSGRESELREMFEFEDIRLLDMVSAHLYECEQIYYWPEELEELLDDGPEDDESDDQPAE